LIGHVIDSGIHVVGLLIDVHNLVPELVDISANLVSHLAHDIHGQLILVVHDGHPVIFVQLV